MKFNLKKSLMAAGLMGLVAVPFIAKAEGFDFNAKIADDNEAHYRFEDHTYHHDPEMQRAAELLAEAKTHIWFATEDSGDHRANAVRNINYALDEITRAERHLQDR